MLRCHPESYSKLVSIDRQPYVPAEGGREGGREGSGNRISCIFRVLVSALLCQDKKQKTSVPLCLCSNAFNPLLDTVMTLPRLQSGAGLRRGCKCGGWGRSGGRGRGWGVMGNGEGGEKGSLWVILQLDSFHHYFDVAYVQFYSIEMQRSHIIIWFIGVLFEEENVFFNPHIYLQIYYYN